MMKRWILALLIVALTLGVPLAAHAACATHTYWIDGRATVCTTCCNGGNCITTCL